MCLLFPTGFAKVEKRVRTAGGGSTGSVRNLRIREDTAKYLLNLDTNSGGRLWVACVLVACVLVARVVW